MALCKQFDCLLIFFFRFFVVAKRDVWSLSSKFGLIKPKMLIIAMMLQLKSCTWRDYHLYQIVIHFEVLRFCYEDVNVERASITKHYIQ